MARTKSSQHHQGSTLSLVYSYAPLPSSLDALETAALSNEEEERNTASATSSDNLGSVVQVACRKTKESLWLSYADVNISREFTRFCHRALEATIINLVLLIGIISPAYIHLMLNNDAYGFVLKVMVVFFVFAFVLDLYIHCILRNGHRYTYNAARLRQLAHFIAAVGLVAGTWAVQMQDHRCPRDPEYVGVHGHEATPTTRYYSCLRTINGNHMAAATLGTVTVRLEVHHHLGVMALYLLCQLFAWVLVPRPPTEGLLKIDSVEEQVVRFIICVVVSGVSSLTTLAKHRSLQRGFEAALEVHYQTRAFQKRLNSVDSLLCSMLPPSALQRLMAGTKVLDSVDEGTVFFSDMVQFTKWSSVRSPSEVVAMLSVLVKGFDILAADMEVSKVKTIGDCYWAATGIPTHDQRHAETMVNFGFAFMALVKRKGKAHRQWDYPEGVSAKMPSWARDRRPIQFRVGIHSGPVLGGVLGSQQISYEVFGETSTIANWAEAKGCPMEVVVTGKTKKLLSQQECSLEFRSHGDEVAEVDDIGEDENALDAGGQKMTPKLYIVQPKRDRRGSVGSRSSGQATPVSQGLSLAEEIETDAAKAERRRYIESHLLGTASTGVELDEATFEELMEQYATRKYCCALYTFADAETEKSFQNFVAAELINFRLGGNLVLLLLMYILFVLFLVDARGDISPACLSLHFLCLLLLSLGAALLYQRRTSAEEESSMDADVINRRPYLEFIITTAALICWFLAAFVSPDSVVTNKNNYLLGVVFLTISLPYLHLPSAAIILGVMTRSVLSTLHQVMYSHFAGNIITGFILGFFWYLALTVMFETRLRVQFLESKVAHHFASKQQVAVQAQEAVLGTIVPDFVIPRLMRWLASDFDPLRTVVQNHESISVAFMRLSAPKREEKATSDAANSTEWLYAGHQVVDDALTSNHVVDKVKTVGDVVMIAGSFRGHSNGEAALAMLWVAVTIRNRFTGTGNDDAQRTAGSSGVTIGLHAGPVMGIVLGYSRLTFDIFGDAVNTTSRVMTSPVATKQSIVASSNFTELLPAAPFPLSGREIHAAPQNSRRRSSVNEGAPPPPPPRPPPPPPPPRPGSSSSDVPPTSEQTLIEYSPPCEVTAKGKGVLLVRVIQAQKVSKKSSVGVLEIETPEPRPPTPKQLTDVEEM